MWHSRMSIFKIPYCTPKTYQHCDNSYGKCYTYRWASSRNSIFHDPITPLWMRNYDLQTGTELILCELTQKLCYTNRSSDKRMCTFSVNEVRCYANIDCGQQDYPVPWTFCCIACKIACLYELRSGAFRILLWTQTIWNSRNICGLRFRFHLENFWFNWCIRMEWSKNSIRLNVLDFNMTDFTQYILL